MKSVAGHQPNLYPYPGFFAKIAMVNCFVIVDNVQYVKKEYHNRNKIKFSDGTAKWLSIPVKNTNRYKQLIMDAEIDNSKDWRKIHKRSIELNYRKAPFFNDFFPVIEALLSLEWQKNAEYNIAFIKETAKFLSIKTPIFRASELNITGEASNLIANICLKTKSEIYLHGIHALDYVDFNLLAEKNIKSLIQKFSCPHYPQLYNNFIPNLSIIDLIMNCGGKKSLEIIQQGSQIFTEEEARTYLSKIP
ncbi:MAG TPA: WbqC family protein [Victivallales bacterium]|nr:WbqC family protein [Victivallales bacterium]HPO90525.1 WbqC family protein [Victivallales bacterium]HRR29367.1 WbqC family protein [Victivallales bacterium]HRU01889.1 WbqC family protein [Victivallales bacterium]